MFFIPLCFCEQSKAVFKNYMKADKFRSLYIYIYMCVCVCVCVCMMEVRD
jgi:hypothetical protein